MNSLHNLTVPAAIREQVVLTEDVFLISENHRSGVQIQSFYRQVRDTLGREPVFVSLPELKKYLSQGDSSVATSQNQQKVIELFRQARACGASDIHMEIGNEGVTRIKMRVNGDLEDIDSLEVQEGMDLASTIVLSMCDMAEKQFNKGRQQDGRIASKFLEGLSLFGARYAHTPDVSGLYVVMRIIPDDGDEPPTLEALGYLPQQIALLTSILRRPQGMLVLSGPTGSGKSTTLRSLGAMYMALTHYLRRLLTIEDPPEGRIRRAIQTAITGDRNNPDEISAAWVRMMTAGLRLDPDGILVGEMRCVNSARTAIIAAMTGHIILSTLHANDPFNILERLAMLGINTDLIADPLTMTGLVSQRLVQTLCPHCSLSLSQVRDTLSADDLTLVERYCDPVAVRFRNMDGCEHCRRQVLKKFVSCGVAGRSVIAEVVHPDRNLLRIYRQEGPLAARRYWHKTLGGITRNAHLMTRINAGQVDPLHGHSVSPLSDDEVYL